MRRAFAAGHLSPFEVRQRFQAWIAHAANANSHNLILNALDELRWFLDQPHARTR